jgi:hypothetical protein
MKKTIKPIYINNVGKEENKSKKKIETHVSL